MPSKQARLLHIITDPPRREEVLVMATSVYAHQKLLQRRVVERIVDIGVARRVIPASTYQSFT